MNEQDLRVIKTKERIEEALLELLKTRPLEKVTVTELARVARINKGTFYLHYLDIFDLYQQIFRKYMGRPLENADFFPNFFDDPELFLRQLGSALGSGLPEFRMLWQDDRQDALFFDDIRDMICEKVYATGRIPKCPENDIKLDIVFSAMLGIMPKYIANHGPEAHRLLAATIRLFFPNGAA